MYDGVKVDLPFIVWCNRNWQWVFREVGAFFRTSVSQPIIDSKKEALEHVFNSNLMTFSWFHGLLTEFSDDK